MEYTSGQENALKGIRKWLNDSGPQVKYLAGYAGTGKTTIAKMISEWSKAHFCAYTGKAAMVLREKGCLDATTVHSLIYTPIAHYECPKCKYRYHEPTPSGKCTRFDCTPTKLAQKVQYRLRERGFRYVEDDAAQARIFDIVDADGVIVVDECSMLSKQITDDLLSFGTRVLVIGDPFQLPPIDGAGSFTHLKPDWMLDQVQRHAKESGVLRLATDIREQGRFNRAASAYGHDAEVVSRSKYKLTERYMDTDQLLVGKNATRKGVNANVRAFLGMRGATELGLPTNGDLVVCLKNNREAGLVNGQQWSIAGVFGDRDCLTLQLAPPGESEACQTVLADADIFLDDTGTVTGGFYYGLEVERFDFAYAMTVHKSQGSQWKHVTVFDESGAFRENRLQWLYTAVTRAVKQVVVVV